MAKASGESENTSPRGRVGGQAWGSQGSPGSMEAGGAGWEGSHGGCTGLLVSPQVRMALQVPGQRAVAADRPEGGEGDLGDPHARALRC